MLVGAGRCRSDVDRKVGERSVMPWILRALRRRRSENAGTRAPDRIGSEDVERAKTSQVMRRPLPKFAVSMGVRKGLLPHRDAMELGAAPQLEEVRKSTEDTLTTEMGAGGKQGKLWALVRSVAMLDRCLACRSSTDRPNLERSGCSRIGQPVEHRPHMDNICVKCASFGTQMFPEPRLARGV